MRLSLSNKGATFHCVVDNTHGVGLLTDNVFNSVSIEDSVFMGAGECSNTKQMRFPLRSTVRQWFGNVRLRYGYCNCSKHGFEESTVKILAINASWFMNGNGNARGLEVSVHCPNVRVIINNVTIGNNSGGNLQLNVTDFNDGFQNNIKISNSCIYGGRGSLGSGMEFLSRTPNLKIREFILCS